MGIEERRNEEDGLQLSVECLGCEENEEQEKEVEKDIKIIVYTHIHVVYVRLSFIVKNKGHQTATH